MQNAFRIINRVFPKEENKSKHKLFKKRTTFYIFIQSKENKGLFTSANKKCEKEKYLRLRNAEIRNSLSKLKLSFFKLAIVTGKCHKTKKEERIWNFCDLNEVEDEFKFLLQFPAYKDLRKELTDYIITTENINFTLTDKICNGKLHFLCYRLPGFFECPLSNVLLVSLLLTSTYFRLFSSVSVVEFEHVFACWVEFKVNNKHQNSVALCCLRGVYRILLSIYEKAFFAKVVNGF